MGSVAGNIQRRNPAKYRIQDAFWA
jgi:hypothetical protein